jgi:hypothetical protein
VIYPYMHITYVDEIHPSINLSFNLPLFLSNLMYFIILFSCIHIKYFNHIHHPIILHLSSVSSPSKLPFYTHVILF